MWKRQVKLMCHILSHSCSSSVLIAEMSDQLNAFARDLLLNAFRNHFNRFKEAVTHISENKEDAIVISRIGDDLDEFATIVTEASLRKMRRE